MSHREARGGGNYKTNYRKSLFCNGVRIPRAPKGALNKSNSAHRYADRRRSRIGRRRTRARTETPNQVAQLSVLSPLANALAESFDLNDGPAHHPTSTSKYAPPKMTPEIMPYLRAP